MTIVDVVENSLRFVVNIFSHHLKFEYTVVRVFNFITLIGCKSKLDVFH